MNLVKFHDDTQVLGHVFTRNSVWEFKDSFDTLAPPDCDNACERFVRNYRIPTEIGLLTVTENDVVKIDLVINKDYTEEEWNAFIMHDALVEDGDYVKAWRETFGINKPVKESADQCDYTPEWKKLNVKIKEKYGTGGFE